MNAIKDYVSQSLSDSDAPTICLRFMGDYDPIVLGRLISKFYNFFVINSYKNSNYKHFLVKLTLKWRLKLNFGTNFVIVHSVIFTHSE